MFWGGSKVLKAFEFLLAHPSKTGLNEKDNISLEINFSKDSPIHARISSAEIKI